MTDAQRAKRKFLTEQVIKRQNAENISEVFKRLGSENKAMLLKSAEMLEECQERERRQ